MLNVQILCHQGTVVLRARNSELLILPQHVFQLKQMNEPQLFSRYFLDQALVNRPARKLFEAWLRKDKSVWPRLFKTVHNEAEFPKELEDEIREAMAQEDAGQEPAKQELAAPEADTAKEEKAVKTKKTAKKSASKATKTTKTTKTAKTTKSAATKKTSKKTTTTTKKASSKKKKTS